MRLFALIVRSLLNGPQAFSDFVRLLCRLWGQRRPPQRGPASNRDPSAAPHRCVPIRRPEFVRPDPLIYDQYYLMSLGLAVTWNNPDIMLRLGGALVSSDSLSPGTTYEIVARVWNNSTTGPVVAMLVHFSYLQFGVGMVSIPIGLSSVDLGVKGGANQPAFVTHEWTTPTEPGHYCIQVWLDPADDINRLNNLGQENTNVVRAHSPASSTFPLRNDTVETQQYHFEVDAYVPGQPPPCEEAGDERDTVSIRRARMERHRRGNQPLPPGWRVSITPDVPTLAAGETVPIAVEIVPPDAFRGVQPINVNAFRGTVLAGGVTFIVGTE